MVHVAVGAVLFAALMVITAVLFTIWLVALVVRWMWRLVMGGTSRSSYSSKGVLDTRMCSRDRCRAVNPSQAQFCRRCGTSLNDAAAVGRRVAV